MEDLSHIAQNVVKFINQTNRSLFLTGKAGTGKTTLLHHIIANTHKNTAVVAPTGIAALNAGGVTIHSLFQLPFGSFIPEEIEAPVVSEMIKFETKATLSRQFKMGGLKISVLRNLDLLVIDEVSMLRADVLDAIDFVLKKVRRNIQAFGGVQVLFIGDLLQLPPVVKPEEWHILRNYYQGIFFFHSHVIQQAKPLYIELTKIYRQSDDTFISILNNLRNNNVTPEDTQTLSQYINEQFDYRKNPGYITLTTHNKKADELNATSLDHIRQKEYQYLPEVVGDFPEKIYPLDDVLVLKEGAQVMFIKNDLSQDKNYFNGKMGVVQSLEKNEIFVHFPEENKTIEVDKYEWKNIRYKVNEQTKEVEEETLGTFVQYPVKLAWAITVHKSQGLTFDKAAIDVSDVFQPGQAYVALSRVRSLDGLVLLSPLTMNGIKNDHSVMSYAQNKADEDTIKQSLTKGTKIYLYQFLKQTFDFMSIDREWELHVRSYQQNAVLSEKSNHKNWASSQQQIIQSLLVPAKKFSAQLDQLFSQEPTDYRHIQNRINAAIDYFLPKVDEVLYQLLLKMEELKRVKRVKEFYTELYDLEDMQTKANLRLLRAKTMMQAFLADKELNKENLLNEEIKVYKTRKIEKVKTYAAIHFATLTSALEDNDDGFYYPKKAKKQSTKPKKATIEETLDLWNVHKSISKVAEARSLTEQTIFSHLSKLVKAKSVLIVDILPIEKIERLTTLFQGYTEASVTPLKEKVGEEFSYEELRLFKAYKDSEA